MISININKAKTLLSSYLDKAVGGEKVIICRHNRPIAELRPLKQAARKKRPIGLANREFPSFTVANTFFEPLPEELIDAFSGKGK